MGIKKGVNKKCIENRAGVWLIKQNGKKRAAVHIAESIKDMEGFKSVFWAEEVEVLGGSDYIYAEEIEQSAIDQGEDITEEYLLDAKKAVALIDFAPDWLEQVLSDRPEVMLSKDIIRTLSSSEDKDLRILAIKYLPRMARDVLEKAVETEATLDGGGGDRTIRSRSGAKSSFKGRARGRA